MTGAWKSWQDISIYYEKGRSRIFWQETLGL